jgi:hypothetical protein
MKKLIAVFALVAVTVPASAQVYVPGYVRSDGVYVQGHVRSAPNSTTLDNYSTKGNINPYNGKRGTVDPYPLTRTYTPPVYQPPVYQPRAYTPPVYTPPCYYNCD